MSAGWPAVGMILIAGASVLSQGKAPAPGNHVVEIRAMTFHPAVLEVQRGDTVVWINRDIVPHTATAGGRTAWNTGPLVQGQSGRHVPKERGDEPYFCELHPTMQGRLVVK